MWSKGILCLLLSLVVQLSTLQTEAFEENTVSLKISIRQDVLEGVASCVQAPSQVTVENLVRQQLSVLAMVLCLWQLWISLNESLIVKYVTSLAASSERPWP